MDFERYLKLKEKIGVAEEGQAKAPAAIRYPFADLVERQRRDGGEPLIIQKSTGVTARDTSSPYGQYAIVERERINAKGESEGTDIEIQSEVMQEALCSIIGKHSQIGTNADPIVFKKPYYALFHCRGELQRMAKRESNTPIQKQHLQWLVDFIANNLKALDKVHAGLVQKGLVDFKHLPLIFEAGSVVVGQILGDGEDIKTTGKIHKTTHPECFLFYRLSEPVKDESKGTGYIEIEVLRWGFNGSMFGLTKEKTRVRQFAGARKITDLECYPLQYLEDEQKNILIPKLIERGKKWCQWVEAKNLQYQGIAIVPQEREYSFEIRLVPKMMSGRVILDYNSFIQAFSALSMPLHSENVSTSEDRSDDVISPDGTAEAASSSWRLSSKFTIPQNGIWSCHDQETFELTPAQALLCPGLSVGYSLQQKEWGYFDVDLLDDVEWAEEPVRRLEIPELHKDVLMDLIMEHNTKPVDTSVAAGKGEGLLFLLSGPPGCGKTLTAELIAEQENRALIRVTSGDLGDRPWEVESKLGALLGLAVRASAIVLIDEADTFIAKRSLGGSIGDYFHNCIVAIFLKQLEYFPGIIFLTTNHDESIDPAIISRVIRLRYGPLGARGRAKIWKHHLSRADSPCSDEEMLRMCQRLGEEFILDGREIKTLSNLSLTICRRKNQEISEEVVRRLFDLTHGTSVIGA